MIVSAPERDPKATWLLCPPSLRSLTLNVRKMFQEMDVAMYNKCLHKMDSSEVRWSHGAGKGQFFD